MKALLSIMLLKTNRGKMSVFRLSMMLMKRKEKFVERKVEKAGWRACRPRSVIAKATILQVRAQAPGSTL
jgi:hypothetical protein